MSEPLNIDSMFYQTTEDGHERFRFGIPDSEMVYKALLKFAENIRAGRIEVNRVTMGQRATADEFVIRSILIRYHERT